MRLKANHGCLKLLCNSDPRVLVEIGGLIRAFLRSSTAEGLPHELGELQERGRLRRQAIPKAVDALLQAAASYRGLQTVESVDLALVDKMEQEAFRLVLQSNRWKVLHNEKRFGLPGNFLLLVILEDFVRFWTERNSGKPSRLTRTEIAQLITAGHVALGQNRKRVTADDVRGVDHFRANLRNRVICDLSRKYADYLAGHLDQRPFLIPRNEIQ